MLTVAFEVPVPLDRCWSFVVEDYFVNHRRWDAGLEALERFDDGPVRPGVRGREVRSFGGEKVSEFEIVEVDAPTRLVLRDEPGLWSLQRAYTFEQSSVGTAVTVTFDMRPNRAWFKLVYPIVSRLIIHPQVRANMERLRTLLAEQEPAVDHPTRKVR